MDGLPPLSWASIGPVGLLSIAVLLILLGRLIPWVTWRAWQTTWTDRLADAKAENEKLHSVVQQQMQTLELYNSQLKQLLEGQKATESLLMSSLHTGEVSRRAVVVVEEAQDPNGHR